MSNLPLIKSGSQGPYVSYCQNLLNARLAGQTLWVDGIFGVKTDAAVKRFQTTRNLKIDGKVGTNTWNALEAGPPVIKKRPTVVGASASGNDMFTENGFPNPNYNPF